MTESDLAKIEKQLNLKLPDSYRKRMLAYPIPADAGTTNGILWDDTDAVIEMNQKYHRGFAGGAPWPEQLFFVGDDGAASPYALDVSLSPPPVLYLDHGVVDDVLEKSESIDAWIGDYLKEIGDLAFQEPQKLGIGRLLLYCTVALVIGVLAGTFILRFLR